MPDARALFVGGTSSNAGRVGRSGAQPHAETGDVMGLALRAVALGWTGKWRSAGAVH